MSCQSPAGDDAGARALSQMMMAGLRNMTVSAERLCAVGSSSGHQSCSLRGAFKDGSELLCFRSVSRQARFVKDKIVAVILAFPEPFTVLALMNRGIEFGDRQQPMAKDKTSLVAVRPQIRKNILDVAGREMAVLALEHQQRRVLPQDALRALPNLELGALDVDLEQRNLVACAEIIVERDHRHGQRGEASRPCRGLMKGCAGLMAGWQKQVPLA